MNAQNSIKINNSYESEPSSGSSLVEPLEYNAEYDENMHLPYIVKPPSYETEVIIPADGNLYILSQENKMSSALPEIYENQLQTKKNESIASPPQSQELVFKGFTESPYGKLQREFFPSSTAYLPQVCPETVPDVYKEKEYVKPKVGTTFSRFFDMVVDENSCNAVDIQLSNEETVVCDKESHDENGVNYLVSLSKEEETVMSRRLSKPFSLSVELSFNGKIKSLTPPSEYNDSNIGNLKQYENQSFVLKKYSNEKSPDLFGDDDEDDDDNDGNVDEDNEFRKDFGTQEFIEVVPTSNYEDDTTTTQNMVKEMNSSLCEINVYENTTMDYAESSTKKSPTRPGFVDEQSCKPRHTDAYSLFRENCRREKELFRRIRKCLAGIPPPPSVTIPQLDMFSEVSDRKADILNFSSDNVNSQTSSSTKFESLFKPTHSIDEAKKMGWRQVLGVRQHGFCFNLCKASENNEYLGLSVIERFIGAETASSYRNSPSSAKKRNARIKLLTQSPGNRLSHLARRRATFSSVQLANQKSNNLRGPQILMDVKKKNKHRRKNTPKRMTPGSKKKSRKTPSSSARKRLFRCDLIKPGPSREASKRALFQSPPKQSDQRQPIQRQLPTIKPEIANRIEKSKRALFSPDKRTGISNTDIQEADTNSNYKMQSTHQSSRFNTLQFDSILKRKRADIDDDDTGDSMDLPSQSSKLFRGGAENLTPRALKIKSQSFCIGASSLSTTVYSAKTDNSGMAKTAADANNDLVAHRNAGISSSSNSLSIANSSSCVFPSSSGTTAKIQRSHSDMVAQTNTLTENQRKKLLWAVSQALQEKKITTKHESFKQYAGVLARVVRRIFQEFFQRSSTSNSETLLRLSKRYVHFVIAGRSADEVYLQAKTKIIRDRNESSCRLSGYIGPEEYQRLKNSQQQQSQDDQISLFSQNSICSGSISILFSGDVTSHETQISSSVEASTFKSQSLLNENTSTQTSSLKKLPIQPNASLQNSSSKNNMCGLALRENVNFESDQRRSAQKNFTGKDQRNVSPYANNNSHCLNNNQLKSNNCTQGNSIKCIIPQMQAKHIVSDSSLLHLSSTKVKRQISFDN